MPTTPIHIEHNPAAQRFEAVVDGHLSVAEYHEENGRIVFTHTFVPEALRGRGIAEQLVRTALDWARGRGLPVEPQCSYVDRYIQRHREFSELVR